jgi:hypothetical protein
VATVPAVSSSNLQLGGVLNFTSSGGAAFTDSTLVIGGVLAYDGLGTSTLNLNNSVFDADSMAVGSRLITLGNLARLDMFSGSRLRGNVVSNISGPFLLDTTSTIVADGSGHGPGTGPGAGTNASAGGGGGGGYGGVGGDGSAGTPGGLFYDSALNPALQNGSGGGSADSGAAGGNGAGTVDIAATGSCTFNGRISANGQLSSVSGSESGGGGSGGGIRVRCNILTGNGTVEAYGGNAAVAASRGGGGGGGRIIFYVNDWSAFTGFANTSVRAGQPTSLPPTDGEAFPGTAAFYDPDDANLLAVSSWRFEPLDAANYANLNNVEMRASGAPNWGLVQASGQPMDVTIRGQFLLSNNTGMLTGGDHFILTADSVRIRDVSSSFPSIGTDGANFIMVVDTSFSMENGARADLTSGTSSGTLAVVGGTANLSMTGTSTVEGNFIFVGNNATTGAGSAISARYGRSAGAGQGAPLVSSSASGGSGAGHGGLGGLGTGNSENGTTYDSELLPVLLGSGGANANDGVILPLTGGQGGGTVRIEAATSTNLSGDINVNGWSGLVSNNYGAGGGSAGSIYVTAGQLDANASAVYTSRGGDGGDGVSGDGGGGSGGLVAMCSNSGTNAAVVLISGGSGPGAADDGASGKYTNTCTAGTAATVALMTVNALNVGDGQIGTANTNYPMMAFDLREVSGNEGMNIEKLTVATSGTMNDVNDIANFELVHDANFNGVFDAGDVVLAGPESFLTDNGQITFTLGAPFNIARNGDASFIIIADSQSSMTAPQTIELCVLDNSGLQVTGLTTFTRGQVVGAPMCSGIKVANASPGPIVTSFFPSRARNDAFFSIDVYGVNLTGVTGAAFDSTPSHLFTGVVADTNIHFTGTVDPAAPNINPGYYNTRATTGNGTNATSAMQFEYFSYCNTGLLGPCGVGELIGATCIQTVFPEAETCGDGIDQDCSGSDLSCFGTDDDGDGYTELQGDCDDSSTGNSPGLGEVCISGEVHLPLSNFVGVPRNLSSHHVSSDTRNTRWMTNNSSSWYTAANGVLVNSAALFDGTSDRLDVSASLSLSPQTRLTVMGWVRFDSSAAANVPITWKGGDTQLDWEYGLYFRAGTSQFGFGMGFADGSTAERTVNASIVVGHWYQVVGTYNADTGNMRLYLDGVLVDAAPVAGSPAPRLGASDLYIGGHPGSGFASFNGRIDEVRVYGSELQGPAISQDHSDLRAGISSSLGTDELRMFQNFDFGFGDAAGSNNATPVGDTHISGRSGRYEFPPLVYLLSTSSSVDILDESHNLWMRIPVTGTNGVLRSGNIDFAEMANGQLVVGGADAGEGLVIFNFAEDVIWRIDTVGPAGYMGNFEDLYSGSFETPDPHPLPSNVITGLDIAPDGGDSAVIAFGMPNTIMAIHSVFREESGNLDIIPNGFARTAIALSGNDELYYTVNDPAGPQSFVISGVTAWADEGPLTQVASIVLPGAATGVNDAAFGYEGSAGPTYTYAAAHDAGITYGQAGPTVPAGSEITHTQPLLLGPTSNVVSVSIDNDSRYSLIRGGGLTHWDDELDSRTEYIDLLYSTNPLGVLPTLSVSGVAGFAEIGVAHDLGASFFPVPISQGSCNLSSYTGPLRCAGTGSCNALQGLCSAGVLYPLAGPPVPQAICIQTVFPGFEYCGDSNDSNCDGVLDPQPAAVCCGGPPNTCPPVVDIGSPIVTSIPDCTPIEVGLQEPIVTDNLDPAPSVTCWTSSIDPVVIDGNFGDWAVSNRVGTSSGGAHYSIQYDQDSIAIRIEQTGLNLDTTDLALQIAISETDDGDGCNLPDVGLNGVEWAVGASEPNWLIRVNNNATFDLLRCNPVADTFASVGAGDLTVATGPDGVELKLDITGTAFTGTEIRDPGGKNWWWFWLYDTATGAVSDTFPGNPEGGTPPNKVFTVSFAYDRNISPLDLFGLGVGQYACSATDFDGNTGSAQISVTVVKSTLPSLVAPPDILNVEATSPAGTYINIYCDGGVVTEASPGCTGGTNWTQFGPAPLISNPSDGVNCASPLAITNNAPAGQLFPVSLPSAFPNTTVTWRVTDNLGMFSEDTQEIRVVDTTPPTVAFVLNSPNTINFGGTVYHYVNAVGDGGPVSIGPGDLATFTVTDNGDAAPVCVYDTSTLNPLLEGQAKDVTLTCTDASGYSTILILKVVRRIENISPPVWVITPDASVSYFNSTPVLFTATWVEDSACSLDPLVSITGADSTPGPAHPNYYFNEGTEGLTLGIQVSGTSACSGQVANETVDVGIDTVNPTMQAGSFTRPRAPLSTTDPIHYPGYFYDSAASETIALLGRVQDLNGCGIQNTDFTMTMLEHNGTQWVDSASSWQLINHTPLLSGSPPQGSPFIDNPPCTGTTWCGGSGLLIGGEAAPYLFRPYRIDMTVTDCAGNTLNLSRYWYHINYEQALDRLYQAINRWRTCPGNPFCSDTDWPAIDAFLFTALDAIEFAWTAWRHGAVDDSFNVAELVFNELMNVEALADTGSPAEDGRREIYWKVREVTRGMRIEAERILNASGDTVWNASQDTQATSHAASASTQEGDLDSSWDSPDGAAPGGSMIDSRWALFHRENAVDRLLYELENDIFINGADVRFASALPLLQDTQTEIADYLAALDADFSEDSDYDMWGRPEMLLMATRLGEVQTVFTCMGRFELGVSPGVECAGQFGGFNTDYPSSYNLADNVYQMLSGYSLLRAAGDELVATQNEGFNLALVSAVAINDGIDNAADSMCYINSFGNVTTLSGGGVNHPLIQAAQSRWDSLEAIRSQFAGDPTKVDDYVNEALSQLSTCLVQYTYNAAYYYDTVFWWPYADAANSVGERLLPMSNYVLSDPNFDSTSLPALPGCAADTVAFPGTPYGFPNTALGGILATRWAQQDLYDNTTCNCNGALDLLYNNPCCTAGDCGVP